MVAETTALPAAPESKGKRGGIMVKIPLAVKLQVRGLYLVHQLGSKEIGAKLKISPRSVENLVHREGWSKLKRSKKARMEEKALARMEEETSEFVEASAVLGEELGIGTMTKSVETLKKNGKFAARDLQAYSQAAKNFIGIAREARGLNANTRNDHSNGQTIIFVGALERVGDARKQERSEINVTPAKPLPEPVPSLQAEIIPPKIAE